MRKTGRQKIKKKKEEKEERILKMPLFVREWQTNKQLVSKLWNERGKRWRNKRKSGRRKRKKRKRERISGATK